MTATDTEWLQAYLLHRLKKKPCQCGGSAAECELRGITDDEASRMFHVNANVRCTEGREHKACLLLTYEMAEAFGITSEQTWPHGS